MSDTEQPEKVVEENDKKANEKSGASPQKQSSGYQGDRGGEGNRRKVFVGNIAEGTTSEQIKEAFGKCGRIARADMVKDYAFVHFETEEECEKALNTMNDYLLNGRNLRVQPATSKERRGGSSDAERTRGCFKCGRPGHMIKDCPENYATGPGPARGPPMPRDPYYDYPPMPPRGGYDPYYDRMPPPAMHRGMPPGGPMRNGGGHVSRYDPYPGRERPLPPPRDAYDDPYYRPPPPPRDPYDLQYRDPYYDRPPAADRYSDRYDESLSKDPYYRPPPEYYERRRRSRPISPPSARDYASARDYGPVTREYARDYPSRYSPPPRDYIPRDYGRY